MMGELAAITKLPTSMMGNKELAPLFMELGMNLSQESKKLNGDT